MGQAERKTPPRFPVVDAAIKKKGTVQRFLREADVKQPTYYAMQSGLSVPTLGLIYKVLDYTGLNFDTAFGKEHTNAQ